MWIISFASRSRVEILLGIRWSYCWILGGDLVGHKVDILLDTKWISCWSYC